MSRRWRLTIATWGDSDGEPRGWFSIPKQLEDWRAAVTYARTLESVDSDRVAVWGMSFAGGYVLVTAADDQRVAAVLSLVGLVDGLAFMLRPAPPSVIAQSLWRATREVLTRRPVTMPVAGPPGTLAVSAAPEAVEGFLRTTAGREPGHEWRNEVNTSPAFSLLRHRPVRRASAIKVPVLLQLGENDGIVPLKPIEKTAVRAPRAKLIRYPMDHFGCFTPEYIDRVAGDQLEFLRRHLVPQSASTGDRRRARRKEANHDLERARICSRGFRADAALEQAPGSRQASAGRRAPVEPPTASGAPPRRRGPHRRRRRACPR